jgi:chemotaxis protein MotA
MDASECRFCDRGCGVDLATVIGLLGALAVVGAAVFLGGDTTIFLDLPAALIVLGGSTFVVMSKFGMGQFAGAFRVAGKAFLSRAEEPAAVIERLLELAALSRRGGLLSLANQQVANTFMAGGLKLLIEGHDPEVVRQALGKGRSLAMERHQWGQRIFLAVADVAPAMGMVGTLIGLVQMLANLDDPRSIGPAMAVALLSMLYGLVLANLVCLPIADKLKLRMAEEGLLQALIIDGLLAIQSGQNPGMMQTMLERYLPESKRLAPAT